jgi:hypothetical protein
MLLSFKQRLLKCSIISIIFYLQCICIFVHRAVRQIRSVAVSLGLDPPVTVSVYIYTLSTCGLTSTIFESSFRTSAASNFPRRYYLLS